MPDVRVDKGITLDLLDVNAPSESSTNDMPVVETHPDAVPNPTPEAATSPVTEEVKTEGSEESATDDTVEQPGATDGKPKGTPRGVQKKLDELVRREREANQRAESEREERLKLLEIIARQGQPAPQPQAVPQPQEEEPRKPDRNAYADPNDYDNALDAYVNQRAAWIARREVRQTIDQERTRQRQEAIAAAEERARQAYRQRIEKYRETHPDFDQYGANPNVTVTPVMADAIRYSEGGPAIADFLGRNPQEAQRIATLIPHLQLVELGKIEARLTTSPPTPQVSRAPAPIKPPAPGVDSTITDPEKETMDQYAARRKKEWADANKRGVRH